MRHAAALLLLLPIAACAMPKSEPVPEAAPRASLVYPATERQDLIEEQFGVRVADPYRWLEDDVRANPKVRQWVAEQNALTNSYLAILPGRAAFRQRMTELFSYERFTV